MKRGPTRKPARCRLTFHLQGYATPDEGREVRAAVRASGMALSELVRRGAVAEARAVLERTREPEAAAGG